MVIILINVKVTVKPIVMVMIKPGFGHDQVRGYIFDQVWLRLCSSMFPIMVMIIHGQDYGHDHNHDYVHVHYYGYDHDHACS